MSAETGGNGQRTKQNVKNTKSPKGAKTKQTGKNVLFIFAKADARRA